MPTSDPRSYIGAFAPKPPDTSAYDELSRGAVLQTLADRAAGQRNTATIAGRSGDVDRTNKSQRLGTIEAALAPLALVAPGTLAEIGFGDTTGLDQVRASLNFAREGPVIADLRDRAGMDFVEPLHVDPSNFSSALMNFIRDPGQVAAARANLIQDVGTLDSRVTEGVEAVPEGGVGTIRPYKTTEQETTGTTVKTVQEIQQDRQDAFRERLVAQFPDSEISTVFIDAAGIAHFTINGEPKKAVAD